MSLGLETNPFNNNIGSCASHQLQRSRAPGDCLEVEKRVSVLVGRVQNRVNVATALISV